MLSANGRRLLAAQLQQLLLLALFYAAAVRCDENYLTRTDVANGQLFPGSVRAFVGETVYLRIVNPVVGQQRCTFRRPGGEDVSVWQPGESRVFLWPDHQCGIRVSNVTTGDSGHWRLTSATDGNLTRGYSFLDIQESPITPNTDVRPILNANDDKLTPKEARYCYVLRPEQNTDEFPQHSKCTIPQATTDDEVDGEKAVQSNGLWNVVVGVDGQTDEIQFTVNVAAEVESLNSTIQTNNEKSIQLSCNLVNSPKTITFCRFLRISDGQGFLLTPGQGNGKYNYFGAGLERGECGLSIDNPNEFDRFTWKCFLGYTVGQRSGTLGAILDASEVPKQLDELSADNVYGLNGTAVNILCKAQIAIDYCWFTHPNGTQISVSDSLSVGSESAANTRAAYSYYGVGLRMGECGISLNKATLNDTGAWECHLGTFRRTGYETSRTVLVRISESHLVAAELMIDVMQNSPLNVDCTTIPVSLPLEYCRFVMPDGRGFSIDETVTQHNSLDGIFFNPDRRRIDGYCSIIVSSIAAHHDGRWTCAGRLVGRDADSVDSFEVHVNENLLSAAAVSGMIIGAIIVVVLIAGVGVLGYRKRRRLTSNAEQSIELRDRDL